MIQLEFDYRSFLASVHMQHRIYSSSSEQFWSSSKTVKFKKFDLKMKVKYINYAAEVRSPNVICQYANVH